MILAICPFRVYNFYLFRLDLIKHLICLVHLKEIHMNMYKFIFISTFFISNVLSTAAFAGQAPCMNNDQALLVCSIVKGITEYSVDEQKYAYLTVCQSNSGRNPYFSILDSRKHEPTYLDINNRPFALGGSSTHASRGDGYFDNGLDYVLHVNLSGESPFHIVDRHTGKGTRGNIFYICKK